MSMPTDDEILVLHGQLYAETNVLTFYRYMCLIISLRN
jgi:hypothetical protein